MKIRMLQYVCGLTVLITHMLAVALIGISYRFSDVQDQISSILMVAPITLVYAGAFMRYVVNNATIATGRVKEEEVFYPFGAVVMYLVVFSFCISLLFVVAKFVFFATFLVNEFRMWLGVLKTAFGAIIDIVFERLFGVQPAAPPVVPEIAAPPSIAQSPAAQ